MRPIPLIINADDLGMSKEVNAAIFGLMSRGRISSATIMANGPAVRDAAQRASAFPQCSFGVHLNLTQFEPLTSGVEARRLIGDEGQMSRAIERAPRDLQRLRAIYRELCAQVEHVAALGIRITHLDSHHHVHTKPFVFPALKAVQRRYGIRRVRLSKNFYSPLAPCPPAVRWRKKAYNWALKSIYPTRTTDTFTEFVTYVRAEARLKRSAGRIELMVHPGAPYAAEETALLESEWAADLPIDLISYSHLG